MPRKHHAGSPPEPSRITFHCSACGSKLTVPQENAHLTGPCPLCGAIISPPPTPPGASMPPANMARQAVPAHRRQIAQARTHKGRIRGDSILDHTHLENRESLQSLKVLALFFLTFCACIAIIWLLSR